MSILLLDNLIPFQTTHLVDSKDIIYIVCINTVRKM